MTPASTSSWRDSLWQKALPLARLLGIDRAIFYVLLGRGWSALAGPVSLFFVARFLTREEQGFYYTFSSVLALQVFFELGLAYVIMQSVSHEKAHLEWAEGETVLTGDPRSKARLASLFRFALKWYAAVALLATCVLIPMGFAFFGQYKSANSSVVWHLPWLLVVLATAANLVVTPFVGVLEGCGKVSEVVGLQTRQAISGSLTVWLMMALHCKLYAAPMLSVVSVVLSAGWLLRTRRVFFADLWATPAPPDARVNWRTELLPFQWKISLSWLSGYLIFQLGNPVMFKYHGAVEAGRMGMSIRIMDSITSLAFAWVATKSAPFGSYIAKGEFLVLDQIFKKAFVNSLVVVVAGGGVFLLCYCLLSFTHLPYVNRVLGFPSLCFMAGNAVLNVIIFNQAIYLRAHKQEPFLLNSIAGAITTPLIMYLLGRPYGGLGITGGIFTLNLFIGVPWATWVFLKKKREWHTC